MTPLHRLLPIACCLLSAGSCLLHGFAAAQCTDGACQPTVTAHPAVVRVISAGQFERCYGSGTLVHKDSQRAVVLTCAHLFRQQTGEVAVVFPDGRRFAAEVLAVDRVWDLAALSIPVPQAAPVRIAADYPQPGEPLSSCGYGPDGRYWCNQGQALGYVRVAQSSTYETLELSGRAREGDSGGPVFNRRGELAAVLWGTDGRTVGATYCGRIRKFLATILGCRPAGTPNAVAPLPEPPLVPVRPPSATDPWEAIRQRLDGLGGEMKETRQRLDDHQRSLGERLGKVENVLALVSSLRERVEKAEAAVGAGNLRAVVREVVAGLVAERGPGLLEKALPALLAALGWTAPPSIAVVFALRLASGLLGRRLRKRLGRPSAGSRAALRPLNDDYAKQLAEVYALSGHSPTADATLGREYDQELAQAEQSSDPTLARWAKQLRGRVAQRFYRIHGQSPLPAEPTAES